MRAQQAVRARIAYLMAQHGLSLSRLSARSGISKSVLHDTLKGNPPRVTNTTILTIPRICQAMEISMRDFFDSELFDDLEYEE